MIYYHSVTVRHSKSPVHHGQGIFEWYPNAEVGMARSPKAVRIADGIFYWFAMSVKSLYRFNTFFGVVSKYFVNNQVP